MQVYIKGLDGKESVINIHPTQTVADLKIMCQGKTSVEPENQRLMFGGKQLEDKNTLEYYEIADRSTIMLVVRIGGGGLNFQQFQDLTKPTTLIPWGNGPDWKIAVGGLSL